MLDKKIDSRESYFKSLAKQVEALDNLNKKIANAWISIESARMTHSEKRATLPDSKITRVNLLVFKKCCLKLKVFEDFLTRLNPELKSIARSLYHLELYKKDKARIKRKGVKIEQVRRLGKCEK